MADRVQIQYVKYYTQDNTAKRVAPAIPLHTGALPQIKKRKLHRIYIDPVATLGITGHSQEFFGTENDRLGVMEQQVEILRQQNADLQAQYDSEVNLDAVKEIALALGMVPGREVAHSTLEVDLPQEEAPTEETVWSQIGTFLTGLFA